MEQMFGKWSFRSKWDLNTARTANIMANKKTLIRLHVRTFYLLRHVQQVFSDIAFFDRGVAYI